ncbi:hypothetical protein ACFT8Q_00680 [Streptomyces griseoincarnatus]
MAPGHTLWDIAQRNLGSGLQWTAIYDTNEQTIEDEARRYGFSSSDRGHWIFPGTVLTLPNGGAAGGSTAARAALAKLQKKIADYVAQGNTKYTFGNYVDPDTGRIVLETDAPTNVVSQLTNLPGATASEAQAIRNLRVVRANARDLQSRQDDEPPFDGGVGIVGQGRFCTSGYSVENPRGDRFMVTAGHCFDERTTVRTASEGNRVGTVVNRRLAGVTGDPMDVELISGERYSGQIFAGDRQSTTTIPVAGAEPATVGGNYCLSGAASGEACEHRVLETAGQYCPPLQQCRMPVDVFRGGRLPQQGDSGGPFFTKDEAGNAIIHGHAIALTGAIGVPFGPTLPVPGIAWTGYVEPWDVVSSEFGVHILKGTEPAEPDHPIESLEPIA